MPPIRLVFPFLILSLVLRAETVQQQLLGVLRPNPAASSAPAKPTAGSAPLVEVPAKMIEIPLAGFRCSDSEKNTYFLVLHHDAKSGTDGKLIIVDKKGKQRGIDLTERSAPSHAKVFYGARNGLTAYTKTDFSTEVRTGYRLEKGKTSVILTLILQNREIPGLSCQAKGYSVPVLTPDPKYPAAERHARTAGEYAGMRTGDGHLAPMGVLAVEAGFRRFLSAPQNADPAQREAFANAVEPALKKIEPASVNRIALRLSATERPFFQEVLGRIGYAKHPEVKRLAEWVIDGTQELGPDGTPGMNISEVRDAIHLFVGSRDYQDHTLKEFFVKEVAPYFKRFDQKALLQVAESFSGDDKTLFLRLFK